MTSTTVCMFVCYSQPLLVFSEHECMAMGNGMGMEADNAHGHRREMITFYLYTAKAQVRERAAARA